MTSFENLSEDVVVHMLFFLNYHDLFNKEKCILSKRINTSVRQLFNDLKVNNEISTNFLTCYWKCDELKNIPTILYQPNSVGRSLKKRLFDIFEQKRPHKKLFIANIYTNTLSFMVLPIPDEILFVSYLDNKLSYNIYTKKFRP